MTTQKQTHVQEHPRGGFIHGVQMIQEQGCCGEPVVSIQPTKTIVPQGSCCGESIGPVEQATAPYGGCCGESLSSTGMSTVSPRRGCC
jgi:hypothetical protein